MKTCYTISRRGYDESIHEHVEVILRVFESKDNAILAMSRLTGQPCDEITKLLNDCGYADIVDSGSVTMLEEHVLEP